MEKMIEKAVEDLAKKASDAEKSEDAMRWSQAALNAANTACALKHSRN